MLNGKVREGMTDGLGHWTGCESDTGSCTSYCNEADALSGFLTLKPFQAVQILALTRLDYAVILIYTDEISRLE